MPIYPEQQSELRNERKDFEAEVAQRNEEVARWEERVGHAQEQRQALGQAFGDEDRERSQRMAEADRRIRELASEETHLRTTMDTVQSEHLL